MPANGGPKRSTVVVAAACLWPCGVALAGADGVTFWNKLDGAFGLDSPVQLANNGEDERGNLYFIVAFGGEQNWVNASFSPPLNEWVHVAAVWDRAGIGGTTETAQLYVDEVEVAAITTKTWGTAFQGNHADIAGGGDVMDDKFALDNLVVYDYAETDFSDRFNEDPLATAPGLIIATAAHLSGTLGTNWRTDVEVHNPGATQAAYTIALLKHDADNTRPDSHTFTLAPGTAARYTDIVFSVFGFTGKGALRVTATQENPCHLAHLQPARGRQPDEPAGGLHLRRDGRRSP